MLALLCEEHAEVEDIMIYIKLLIFPFSFQLNFYN